MARKWYWRPARARRGQSEVIGGLIVLTLIFAFAVPLLINSYNSTLNLGEKVQQSIQQTKSRYNEKIEIRPIDPNSEAAQRAGWIPAVYINNTGTTTVELDYLYLVNKLTNSVFRVFDLRYARPGSTPLIDDMLVDVDYIGSGHPPPPKGQPIVLKPGENLVVVFNESILPFASNLIVLVQTASGVLHPLVGAGSTQPLYPGRPSSSGGAAGPGAWRGIFAPQSGFMLVGYDQIVKYSNIWGMRPCHRYEFQGPSYYGWAYDNDPEIPPFLRLEFYRYYGYQLLRGFLGTFDYDPDRTYYIRVDGWYSSWYSAYNPCIYYYTSPGDLSRMVTRGDMDWNGVPELIFYTYWIHYYGGYDYNPDSDFDGNSWSDSVALAVQVARDISGVDYIKVSAKIIYDLAIYGSGAPTVTPKIFSLAVWRYNPNTQSWELFGRKDFDFVDQGPKTFVVSATFPVHRNDTYRVGVIFYDSIKRTYAGAYYEFMMGLEHLIVEYGVLNPLFVESPPLYIIAIPDANIIRDIGEQDFMNAYNLTDINEARVQAQQVLLNKIQEELNYAGVAGYTVIRDAQTACDLLFNTQNPPKYAVIYWLQGNVSLPYVFQTYSRACDLSDADVFQLIRDYHWVFVWPFSAHPFGSDYALQVYNNKIRLTPPGMYKANITDQGVDARKKAYAFYLFNSVVFQRLVTIDPAYFSDIYVDNGTFYYNSTLDAYGTVSVWVYDTNYYPPGGPGTGMLVLNPVHIDWDYTGDGAAPDTVVQQIVYSALRAWQYLKTNY